MSNRKKFFIISAAVLTVMIVSMPGIIRYTSSPQFCNSCHVMNHQYEHWRLTGLHREITCVECHLPNNNSANHLLWKAIDGTKDVVLFTTGLFDQNDIRATNHAKKVLKQNCIRCHNEMVSLMNTEKRKCWSCHRRVQHTYPEISRLDITEK